VDEVQPQSLDLARLFELAPDVIFGIAASDSAFTSLSHSFETIVGWPVADWIGKPFAPLVHPADLPLAEEMLGLALRGESPRRELRILTRSGAYLVGEITAVPRVEDGRVVGLFGIARDVTRRKRMEEVQALLVEAGRVLNASLDPRETLAQAARLAVPVLGDWAQCFVVAKGAIRWRQGAHADPLQEPLLIEIVRTCSPDLNATTPLTRVLRSGEGVLVPEASDDRLAFLATGDEPLRLLRLLTPRSAMLVPFATRDQTFGVMAIVSSAPGRRYALEDLAIAELLAQRAALAIENARLFASEREALRLAEAAVREREEFLAVAAHELKTPVTSMHGFAQLYLRQFEQEGTLAPDRLRVALRIIAQQGSRLAGLVNRLLDDSIFTAGTLALETERVDLSALVERAARAAQEMSDRHAIGVETPGPVIVALDQMHLEQVLANLLENAIRYSPNGGPIEVTVTLDGPESARVRIRDHGIGIPEDQRANLFARFHRAHTRSYQSGLGLGLYISRRIVELHGGRIEAEFPVDGGTCIVVTLPASPRDSDPPPSETNRDTY